MSKSSLLYCAIVGFVATFSLFGGQTFATTFDDVTLGQAGQSGLNLGVFNVGPTQISASNSKTAFNTNMGLASGTTTNFSGGGTLTGVLYQDPGATLQTGFSSQFNVTGGVSTQSLAQAVTDVQTAANDAASLTANRNYGSLGNSALTINPQGATNGLGGVNTVVSTGAIDITNTTNDLTINGTANDFFIINVNGDLTVSNGAILLSGGITPDHVLFNILHSYSVNLTNGSSTLNGTFLAPNSGQSINLTPGTVNGAVIGYQIHTSSGPIVNGSPYVAVPGPATLSLMAFAGVLVLAARRRRPEAV